MNEIKWV